MLLVVFIDEIRRSFGLRNEFSFSNEGEKLSKNLANFRHSTYTVYTVYSIQYTPKQK